ncbi:MAG: glycosyltransferase family 2 protein [Bacteroidetes bacterium]|nr:glycosyltransferase family 2 protein [Bacteroidota bacterium]
MSHYPTVAVVILNWNGRKFLEQFLPSVLDSVYPSLQIVVADNGSTDDSIDWLGKNYPTVRLLCNPVNEGFAKGYNTALAQVQAAYYVLLNSDVQVTPGWIEPIIRLMENQPMIAACQPKILSFHQPRFFEYAGGSGGWIDAYGYPFCRGRIFDNCEKDEGQYDDPCPVFWASGCAMFVKASVYHEMNGLDDSFFAHQEEVDLCWRMQLAGYQVYVCPESVVYHVGGGSLPQGNPKKVYLNYRNSLMMLYKNLSVAEKIWKLPLRMTLDGVSGLKELFAGNPANMAAIIKAHCFFYKWIFSGKDRLFFPAKKPAKPHGVYKGSIVWQYFVKKKVKFVEIIGTKTR